MNTMVEAIKVDSRSVACDGGAGPLGHPRVFLAIDKTNRVTCPYCGQVFVYDAEKPAAGH